MSQEEHGALSRLTASIEVLAAGQERTEKVLGKFIEATDARFNSLADRERFSWGKMFSFIGSGIVVAGVVTALLSMRIDNALGPIQTQNQVSLNDRAGLHEDVSRIQVRIDAGRDSRLASEAESKFAIGILTERTNEMYFASHGHYPSHVTP